MRINKQDIFLVIKDLLKYPDAKVCRHYVACNLLSLLEQKGYSLSPELVKAIVEADDEIALQLLKVG